VITLKNDWKSSRTFQNRKIVQASTLGPNKHKRGRLRYREILNAFLKLKTFEKMAALFKNKAMVQASSLGTDKHKRGRLRYLGELSLFYYNLIKNINFDSKIDLIL